jgi:hypothetical protein
VCLDADNDIATFTKNGFFHIHKGESNYDLFMKSERKEAWVNVYEIEGRIVTGVDTYKTQEDAHYNICVIDLSRRHIDTVKIEFNAQQ